MNNYSIHEHEHRFSVWAAGRAASTSRKCRFKVEKAFVLLKYFEPLELECLPESVDFDSFHDKICKSTMDKAKDLEIEGFSYGVAAKLVNVYLKARFVNASTVEQSKVKAIHPPIDSLLLKGLRRLKLLSTKDKEAFGKPWSKFTEEEYKAVIQGVRNILGDGVGMWEIEKYWKGYQ